MKTRSRRRSWRRTSAGPNTASRASWGTDVSELLLLGGCGGAGGAGTTAQVELSVSRSVTLGAQRPGGVSAASGFITARNIYF